VKIFATPAVAARGPGFAPNVGALSVARVVTFVTEELALEPAAFVARARK